MAATAPRWGAGVAAPLPGELESALRRGERLHLAEKVQLAAEAGQQWTSRGGLRGQALRVLLLSCRTFCLPFWCRRAALAQIQCRSARYEVGVGITPELLGTTAYLKPGVRGLSFPCHGDVPGFLQQ